MTRTDTASGWLVSNAMARTATESYTTSWKYEQDAAGVVQRETTFPDATNTTTVVERPDRTTDISYAVGTAAYPSTEHVEETPDPRWGIAAPAIASTRVRTTWYGLVK